MNNSVTLYKSPYTLSSVKQPYFDDESIRDTYLSSIPVKQFSLNFNINLLRGLKLELKLPIDITVCEDYNLVLVVYNNKKYFAYIYDYEQISVGNTKVYCERSVFWEVPDIFSKFESYLIERATFSEIEFNDKTGIVYPELRYKQDVPFSITPTLGQYDTLMIRATVLICSRVPDTDSETYYGSYKQQAYCYLLPQHFTGTALYYKDSSDNIHRFTKHSPSDLVKIIDSLSPYIISMYDVQLPFREYNNGYILPFYGKLIRLKVTDVTYYVYNFYNNADIYKLNVIVSPYQRLRIYFCSPYDYVDLDNGLTFGSNVTLTVKYTFGSTMEMVVEIDTSTDSPINGTRLIYTIRGSAGFVRDQKSVWNAENRYYDTIANNEIERRVASSVITTISEAGVGVFQASLGSELLGGSNIIRSVGTLAGATADAVYSEKLKALNKKQNEEKPSTFVGASNYESLLYSIGEFYIQNFIPYSSDINEFFESSKNYGIDCVLSYKSLKERLNTFVIDNRKFFIKGYCRVSDGANIVENFYTQFITRLTDGVLFISTSDIAMSKEV